VRLFLAGLLLAGALAGAPPLAAQTGPKPPTVGIRLLEAPTSRKSDPRAHTYIIDHLAPGTTISRRIGVVNGTPDPIKIQLYPGAAVVEGGGFVAQPRSVANELTGWMSVSPASVDVVPGATAEATVTIAVPAAASSGEQYGEVWGELPAASGASPIAEINRVGIRVYLSVGPGGEPRSDFSIDSLTASRGANGAPSVSAQVHNTGQRALDLSGELSLTNGPGGLSGGPFPARLGTTLGIGQTEPVVVPLDQRIPGGTWDAKITLRSGVLEHAATGRITFPVAAGASSPPVKASPADSRTAPWRLFWEGVAGLSVLLLFGWLWWWLLLLWRRRRDEDDEDGVGVVAAPA
jgi:hypothetical protein